MVMQRAYNVLLYANNAHQTYQRIVMNALLGITSTHPLLMTANASKAHIMMGIQMTAFPMCATHYV